MKTKALILLLIFFVLANAFSQEISQPSDLVAGNNQFAFDLYAQIKDGKGNIFFSPYSISMAMAMLYAGARGNTAEQIADVMNFAPNDEEFHYAFKALRDMLKAINDSENIDIAIANSMWAQILYPFEEAYIALIENYYNAEIFHVDYLHRGRETTDRINHWISQNTKELIPEFFKNTLDPRTIYMLINTIYFKGTWLSEFDPDRTVEGPFYSNENETLEVLMMNQEYTYNVAWFDNFEMLEIPYTGNNISMIIILPVDNNQLQAIEEQLNAEQFSLWCGEMHKSDIALSFPKFEIKYDLSLKNVLTEMGITDVFNFVLSDLSGMAGENPLSVTTAEHSAVIKVNEEGTEAAAVTAVGCFPAGTGIHTSDGLVPIESIEKNTKVYAYDIENSRWILANVSKNDSLLYDGDMVTIYMGAEQLVCTGNQPIYVVAGSGLDHRPIPRELVNSRYKTVIGNGRWVEARDLMPGDTLMDINGSSLQITGLSSRDEKLEVFYLKIEEYANCAVHELGILAHNEGGGGKESAGPMPFIIDHPFLLFIKDNITGSILFMGRIVYPEILFN